MDEAHAKRLNIENKVKDAQSYASYTYNKQGLTTKDYQVRHLTGDGMPGGLINEHFPDIEGSRGWARQYPGKYFENGGKLKKLGDLMKYSQIYFKRRQKRR